MEQDNVKWKYNLEKHEVVEQPTMEKPLWVNGNYTILQRSEFVKDKTKYEQHIASIHHIPVHGKVDWKDGDDVTGKFYRQHQEEDELFGWGNCDEETYNEAGEEYRRIVAIPIIKQEQEQPYHIQVWYDFLSGKGKIAADIACFITECLKKNQTQEQDNVIGVLDWENEFNKECGAKDFLGADDYKVIKNAVQLIISEFQSRLQSLEASNNFHKQQAHEAIQEQWRLIKENEELKEKVHEAYDKGIRDAGSPYS